MKTDADIGDGSTTDPHEDDPALPEGPRLLTWAKTYGGADSDHAFSIRQTSDGGYIVGARSYSFGVEGGHIWIFKLDESGNVVWEKMYDHGGHEYVSSVQQTSDGGYIVAGRIDPFGDNADLWLLKLDSYGIAVWQRSYHGPGYSESASLCQAHDGGYAVAAASISVGLWLFGLDENGNTTWQQLIHRGRSGLVRDIQKASDDGYLVLAAYDNGASSDLFPWLLKLDSNGNIIWQKAYGSSDTIFFMSLLQAAEGKLVVAGGAESDALIMQTDENGNIIWQKAYGGEGLDHARSIAQADDGGYIVAGDTQSFGEGSIDLFIFKVDAAGNMIWQKTLGGDAVDEPESVQQAADGGVIVAGDTNSFGAGEWDAWVLKLDVNGDIAETCAPGLGKDSSAVVHDASIMSMDMFFSPTSTSATVTDTSVVPLDTSAVVETQCSRPETDPTEPIVPPPPFGGLEATCTSDYRLAWELLLAPWLGGCGFDGSVEHYRVYVSPPGPIDGSTTWIVGYGVEAYKCSPNDGPWETITQGEINFTDYEEGTVAMGTWWFSLPDGREVSGTFNAQCIELTFPPSC